MRGIFYFTFIFLFLFSCKKEKAFSVVPEIEFKEYISFGLDSADFIISFKDGDGDIGILDEDTVTKYDLKLKYLYKDANGVFVPYDKTFGTVQFDTLYYTYKVPNLTPDGQYKALQGDIKVKLRAAPFYHPAHNYVKFEITLWDRAGHQSNTVTTNEITVPK